LPLGAAEIAITRKIALLQLAFDPQPIVGSLEWETNMLRCFQLQDRQASAPRHRSYAENAMLAPTAGEHLGVDKPRIQRRIDATPMLRDDRFQALAGVAIDKDLSSACDRATRERTLTIFRWFCGFRLKHPARRSLGGCASQNAPGVISGKECSTSGTVVNDSRHSSGNRAAPRCAVMARTTNARAAFGRLREPFKKKARGGALLALRQVSRSIFIIH
jgi:hypothetical protein